MSEITTTIKPSTVNKLIRIFQDEIVHASLTRSLDKKKTDVGTIYSGGRRHVNSPRKIFLYHNMFITVSRYLLRINAWNTDQDFTPHPLFPQNLKHSSRLEVNDLKTKLLTRDLKCLGYSTIRFDRSKSR